MIKITRENIKYVTFKSLPKHYRPEYLGIKNNTVRIIDTKDVRFELLKKFQNNEINNLDIRILNTETAECFTKQIKNVTSFTINQTDVNIITWKE